MTFLTLPAWAAWTLLVVATAAAIGAFLIPPRRPTQPVASLHPWRTALDDPGHPSLWARIRRAVSLVLAAAIAAAMAMALSNPVARSGGPTDGRLLIVLDSSWSMSARTPSGGTRWVTAVERARTMVLGAAGREVSVATTAEGVVGGPTRDTARLVRVLDRLSPSGGPDGAWPRAAGADAVHFFTDGALPRAIEPGVFVDSVFTPAANVAVSAFDVQPIASSERQSEAYLAVTNYAAAAQTVRVTVTRGADALMSRSVPIGAGETFRDALPVATAGDARFRVHISAPENALEIDDDAVSWLWASQPLRVGVIGTGSLVPGLLARDPDLRVFAVDPSAYPATAVDVWVFDRWLPPTAPSAAALLIEPPGSSWAGTVVHEEPNPSWQAGDAHQILGGVDTEFVRLQKVLAYDRPGLRPIALSRGGTPIVSVEDSASGRLVVIGFSTADSNIASLSAFPVLIANAIDWLGRPDRGVRRPMGPVALPTATSSVISPMGQSMPLSRSGDSVTTTLAAPGLYRIEARGASRVMTVGLDDPRRSNLQISSVPPAQIRAQTVPVRALPWWMIATWSAFVLVAAEWLTWLRRLTV